MILEQPRNPVIRPPALLVRCQRHHDVPVRLIALSPVPDQVRDPDRRLRLVVRRPAPIEIPVFLRQRERVQAPVFPVRLHHVDMCQQKDRPEPSGPVIPHHEIPLRRASSADKNIALRKTCRPQPSRRCLRHRRRRPGGVARLDLDHLLIDLPGKILIGFWRHVGPAKAHRQRQEKEKSTKHAAHYDMVARSLGSAERVPSPATSRNSNGSSLHGNSRLHLLAE